MSSYMIRRASAEKVSYLIPPRTFFEMCGKAVGGALSLITDQVNRDSYMKYIQDGIIRDDVFWQNGSNAMGPVLVLGLYSELDDPILKKYGFKAQEFLEGIKPALEHFHDIEKSLDNKLFEILNKAEGEQITQAEEAVEKMNSDLLRGDTHNAATDASVEREEDTDAKMTCEVGKSKDKEIKAEEDESFTEEERDMMAKVAEREATLLAMMMQEGTKDKTPPKPFWSSVLKWDWNDTLASQLKPMVSTDFFKSLQKDKTIGCMLHKIKGVDLTYKEGSSSVENVALLSARVMVMDQEDRDKKEVDYDNIAYDELNVQEVDDPRLSVAAQIEVLYDIQHSVHVSAKVPGGDEKGKDGDFTERLVRVGILEGFLQGGKEGKLRWRLSNVREPWEIPPVETDFDFRPS